MNVLELLNVIRPSHWNISRAVLGKSVPYDRDYIVGASLMLTLVSV